MFLYEPLKLAATSKGRDERKNKEMLQCDRKMKGKTRQALFSIFKNNKLRGNNINDQNCLLKRK